MKTVYNIDPNDLTPESIVSKMSGKIPTIVLNIRDGTKYMPVNTAFPILIKFLTMSFPENNSLSDSHPFLNVENTLENADLIIGNIVNNGLNLSPITGILVNSSTINSNGETKTSYSVSPSASKIFIPELNRVHNPQIACNPVIIHPMNGMAFPAAPSIPTTLPTLPNADANRPTIPLALPNPVINPLTRPNILIATLSISENALPIALNTNSNGFQNLPNIAPTVIIAAFALTARTPKSVNP